jgi:signal transduction histidine kinase
MRLEDLRRLDLLASLRDDQLEQLLEAGSEHTFEYGDVVFREGAHADSWWVLLDGALELVRHVGRETLVVGRMDVPGRWSGGFRAWDAQGVYLATGRGIEPGRLLRVPSERLREFADEWFPLGVHLIEGLNGTARAIESTVRQRSALVTLGTLSAGLAHELNNPASAAVRAVDALDGACASLLEALGRLAQARISAAQFSELDGLRRKVEPPPLVPDPLAIAAKEDALSSWLADHGVGRDWIIGPALAAAGVDVAWCEQAAGLLEPAALEPALEWVAATLSVTALLGEVRESTRRVSELVGAVRTYSQMDRAAMQRLDVREGLESTLLVLGHKLRHGVEVVRRYGPDVALVEGYPGELNQVWTNLIDNAVDAMDAAGTLTVTARSDHDEVVVEIEDTGTGMPPEVAARAFDAFFTTKDVGKGTGLGLDVAKRIVEERHHGSISIDSRPGATTVRVCLPRTRPT